jgi:hypothetical protein
MPKGIATGNYLTGGLTLPKTDNEAIKRSSQIPVRYSVLEWGKRQGKALSTVVVSKKTENNAVFAEKEAEEALRDKQIEILTKITDKAFAQELFSMLLQKWPTHLPLLQVRIKKLAEQKDASNAVDLLQLCDLVLQVAQPDEVLKFMGGKIDNCEEDLLNKQEMDKRKSAIIEALYARANVMCDNHLAISTEDVPQSFRLGLSIEPTTKATNGTAGDKEGTPESTDEGKQNSSSSDLENLQESLQGVQVEDNNSFPTYPISNAVTGTELVNNGHSLRYSQRDVDDACTQLLKWLEPTDSRV